MIKGTAPTDPLGATPEGQLMPNPAFAVGDTVTINRNESWRYFRRRLLRHLICQMREADLEGGNRGPMHPHRKGLIRRRMELADRAAVVEVAGVQPMTGLPVSMVCNTCYVRGVPGAASPILFHFYLLFISSDQTCFVPPIPMANEYCLEGDQ